MYTELQYLITKEKCRCVIYEVILINKIKTIRGVAKSC